MLQVTPTARAVYTPTTPPSIAKLIDELGRMGHRTPQALTAALIDRLEESADVRAVVARFVVFTLAADAAGRDRRRAVQPTPQQRESHRIEARKVAQVVVAKVAERIVLDMTMPNNKRLRFCTGQEVAAFGIAFAKIAEKVGPDCLVGEKLTEAEARELLGSMSNTGESNAAI
jgi:hypothetical protein